MEVQTSIPVWVLVTLLGVFFSGFVGLFVWITNLILRQNNETNKKQDDNLEKLTQAVAAIKEQSIVTTEMIKRHDTDIEKNTDRIDKILEYLGKSVKK